MVQGVCLGLGTGLEELEGVSMLVELYTVVGGLEAAEAAEMSWAIPFPFESPFGLPFCPELLPLAVSLLPAGLVEEDCVSRKNLFR